MPRTPMILTLALVLGTGPAAGDERFTTSPTAARPARAPRAAPPRASSVGKIMGVVTAIDVPAGTITISPGGGAPRVYPIAPDARVMRGYTKSTLAAVRVSDRVTLGTVAAGGLVTVKTIKITPPATAAPAGKRRTK